MSIMPQELGSQYEWGPRYDLSNEELRSITARTLSQPGMPEGRFVGLLAQDEDLCNAARTIERQVFEESFQNDDNVMKNEYGIYDHMGSRRFLIVLDRETQMPAGVLSVLTNSEAGLKTLNDIEKREYLGLPQEVVRNVHGIRNMDTCWDVGTLGVTEEHRGHRTGLEVSTMLYRMFYLLGRREGVSDVVTIVDAGANRNLKLLGVPFNPILKSGPFEYLGSSESHAVHGKFEQFWSGVNKHAQRWKRAATVSKVVLGKEAKTTKRLNLAARAAGMLANGRVVEKVNGQRVEKVIDDQILLGA